MWLDVCCCLLIVGVCLLMLFVAWLFGVCCLELLIARRPLFGVVRCVLFVVVVCCSLYVEGCSLGLSVACCCRSFVARCLLVRFVGC